ncbi:hypothetical protein IMCC3317_17650 [Kordia antarctica]|uniref:Uncharacterized protein n=1 Tax=Kordia antarctica TaxID=1218801 RepID=A0A7L4ZID6_9FLAO|nr:hypothetical protein [Kordia antarctica]QHI36402.1 hypothetical protein IMCC3317_17650 [Kordia antarctica]
MESKKGIRSLLRMNPILWKALLIILLVGIVLLAISNISSFNSNFKTCAKIVHEIGVLCITITPILFVYELALRRLFVHEMSHEVERVINKIGIKEEVANIVRKSLPKSYDNILSNGISDAFPYLDPEHLRDRIIEAQDAEIKILKIWIPFLDEAIEPNLFIDAIDNRNCKFKIILFDPKSSEAIEKRVRTLNYSQKYFQMSIHANLNYIHSVWKKIKNKDNLMVKVHDDFISASLIGFKDYFVMGLYLHERIATRSLQLKIEKIRNGKETEFFKQINQHFNSQWNNAYKKVVFTESDYSFSET